MEKIYAAFMSPGSVTERIHFFIGEYQPGDRVGAGGGLEEEGEDIEVLELGFEQALAMVQSLSLIHISEPTRLGMISYAVFCLKKKNTHLRAHETRGNLVCRLLLEKKKKKKKKYMLCAV